MPNKLPVKKPTFDHDVLKKEFASYSRGPFVEVLAHLVGATPDPDALQAFADQYPDRWANAIGTLARLSGYHDKLVVEGNINVDIQTMGDADLMKELKETNRRLKDLSFPLGPVQDLEVEEIEAPTD